MLAASHLQAHHLRVSCPLPPLLYLTVAAPCPQLPGADAPQIGHSQGSAHPLHISNPWWGLTAERFYMEQNPEACLSPSSCRQHVQRLFPVVLSSPQWLQPHTVACRYPGRDPSCSTPTARQPLYRAGPQDERRTAHLLKGGSHGARRGLAMFLGMSLQVSLVQFATWGASQPCKLQPPAGEPIGP